MLNCPHICRPTLSVERNRQLNGGQQMLPSAANAAKYPLLAAEAKRYFSVPLTSVASERM